MKIGTFSECPARAGNDNRQQRLHTTLTERFAQPIKQLIEEQPAFGYRTVAHLLGCNKNTVQRVFRKRVGTAHG